MEIQKPTSRKHSRRSTIRVQNQKLNYVSGLLSLTVGILLSAATYTFNPLLAIIIAGLALTVGKFICSQLIMRFSAGTFLNPKGPFEEEVAGRSDEQILVEEFVRLGGVGSSKVAAKLPNNVGHITMRLTTPSETVAIGIRDFFLENGVLLKNEIEKSNSEIKGLIGCGIRHLNPSFITVSLSGDALNLEVNVHAFAKEGMVKQKAGEEAANFVAAYLESEFNARRITSPGSEPSSSEEPLK